MQKNLEAIRRDGETIKIMEGLCGLLGWDMQTYMPPQGGSVRAEQQALLQAMIHEKVCSPSLRRALLPLVKGRASQKLKPVDRAMVREMWRRHSREIKIPSALVKEMARLDTLVFQKWTEAREKADFEIFAPYLSKQVKINRKLAGYIGSSKKPYDALLDIFEPGATGKWIEPIRSDTDPIA